MTTSNNNWLDEVLIRLLADVDDDMEFAGTVWKTKDGAAENVKGSLNEAKQAITAKLAEIEREARIDELKGIMVRSTAHASSYQGLPPKGLSATQQDIKDRLAALKHQVEHLPSEPQTEARTSSKPQQPSNN